MVAYLDALSAAGGPQPEEERMTVPVRRFVRRRQADGVVTVEFHGGPCQADAATCSTVASGTVYSPFSAAWCSPPTFGPVGTGRSGVLAWY